MPTLPKNPKNTFNQFSLYIETVAPGERPTVKRFLEVLDEYWDKFYSTQKCIKKKVERKPVSPSVKVLNALKRMKQSGVLRDETKAKIMQILTCLSVDFPTE
jgi:hypothetical protein